MECEVCTFRGSVTSCVSCGKLLCEECGLECAECGKAICPEHIQTTAHGRTLCEKCYAKREERKSGRKKEAAAVGGGVVEELEEEELEEERILTASVRKPPSPWTIALVASGLGLGLMAVVLIFPGMRTMTLGAGFGLRTPLVLLVIPVIAAAWGVAGLLSSEEKPARNRSMTAIGLAVLTCALGVIAWQTDPARIAEREAQEAQHQRDAMTPEELEQWRQERLSR